MEDFFVSIYSMFPFTYKNCNKNPFMEYATILSSWELNKIQGNGE